MPIHQISVRGIRGINREVSLTADGKSLLIHGDNGTGKSSIERGLRWALLGQEEPTEEEAYNK